MIAADLLRAVKDRAVADAGYATAVQALADDLTQVAAELEAERDAGLALTERLRLAEAALAAAGSGAVAPTGRHVPTIGCLHGLFAPVGDLAHQLDQLAWDPAIVHRFAGTRDLPGAVEKAAHAAGRLPLFTWQTGTGWPTAKAEPVTLDRILTGGVDDMIRRQADACTALAGPLLFRWCHEMNLRDYPWTGTKASTPEHIVKDGPAKYAEAYRRVRDFFDAAGAANVAHVWCPGVTSIPDEPWNHWDCYYPGDDAVDWVGCDGYCRTPDTAAEGKFGAFLRAAPAGKPVMICETSSYPALRAGWLAGLTQLAHDHPRLKGVVLFSVDSTDGQWKLTHDDGEVAALRAMAADSVFATRPSG